MTRSTPGTIANERKRSRRQASPKTVPPAAPAPGVSRSRRPVAASSASAQRAEGVVEVADVDRARALLRAVDGGRAASARAAGSSRPRRSAGRPRRGAGRARRGGRRGSGSTVMPEPQRGQDPEAAVGGGAAADAQVDPPDARVEDGPEHLARAEGGGARPGRARPAARRDRPDAAASSTTARLAVGARPASAPRSRGRAGRARRRSATPSRRPPRSPPASPRRRRRAGPGAARRRGGRGASRRPGRGRPRRTSSEPLNESGATRTRQRSVRHGRRRAAGAADRAAVRRAAAGPRAPGTPGSGSSAGARGRPAR